MSDGKLSDFLKRKFGYIRCLQGPKNCLTGVGTRGIARMPYQNVFGQKGYIDQKVDIDEEMLTKIADMTGGKYFRAENTAGFRRIYDEIDQLEKTEIEVQKYQRYSPDHTRQSRPR